MLRKFLTRPPGDRSQMISARSSWMSHLAGFYSGERCRSPSPTRREVRTVQSLLASAEHPSRGKRGWETAFLHPLSRSLVRRRCSVASTPCSCYCPETFDWCPSRESAPPETGAPNRRLRPLAIAEVESSSRATNSGCRSGIRCFEVKHREGEVIGHIRETATRLNQFILFSHQCGLS